jgi:hypothetical protein
VAVLPVALEIDAEDDARLMALISARTRRAI